MNWMTLNGRFRAHGIYPLANGILWPPLKDAQWHGQSSFSGAMLSFEQLPNRYVLNRYNPLMRNLIVLAISGNPGWPR